MRLLARMFSYVDAASDGSRIPREVVERYLQSDTYKKSIADHLVTGGFTHKDRVIPEDTNLKGVIGKDDMMLLNSNIIYYVEKIFIENDGWVYGILKVLDEDGLDDETVQKIRKFKGMIRNGIKLTMSSVMSAYWSPSEVAEELVRISGADITLNPSFKGSGVIKVVDDDIN